ncbi:MAG: HAMP domain-containing sensor histidine kinase [Myxococcota bacterium]
MKQLWEFFPGLQPRSLRYRALGVVTLVVVLPLLWVWLTGPFEQSVMQRMQWRLHRAVARAVDTEPAGLDAVARRFDVRLRVLDATGEVAADHDHSERDWWIALVEDPFFGPEGPPSLVAYDQALPPIADRTRVRDATPTTTSDCDVVEDGLLLVCTAVVARADGSRIHAMRGSPRLVRSLYDERFQLTAVTLTVLGFGLVVGLWLSWRMVSPIEQLRDQVIQRTEGTVSTEPVVIGRDDEVGQLARAFNALLGALDARNKANAEFAADLAHEIKNPVAAVRAAAETLAGGSELTEDRRARLERVLSASASRLQDVIGQFLELARAEAGLPDAERETSDLLALAEAVVADHRADERHADIMLTVSGDRVEVPVVTERLETALRNLLSNAVAFAGAGETSEVAVAVTVSEGAEDVRIAVQDTGPGVPEALRERIFDRYVTTREDGTGLGLALTRAIVRAHGGTIEVQSPPEGGTAMVVTLPK